MAFLQILGGILLTLILIAVAGYFYFRIKFGKFFNIETNKEPLVIHLNEDISPDWLEKSKVKKICKEVEDLGFIGGSSFIIFEMEGYKLKAYFKEPMIAVVYWHEVAGCWSDIVIESLDSKEYTFSNAPMGGGLNQRPESQKVFDTSATVKTMFDQATKIIGTNTSDFLVVGSNEFREYFENAYAKDIAWKTRLGGISYEEFVKMAKEAPFSTNDKNIKESFIQTKLAELYQWEDVVLDAYREENNIKEDDFYELEYKLFVVPFTTNASAFINYLESKGFINEEQAEKTKDVFSKEKDIFKLFEKINSLLSPDLRAKYISSNDSPLNTKIYQLQDNMVD